MKKCLFWIILLLTISSLYALDDSRVLFISSYHPGYPVVSMQTEGILSVLKDRKIQIDVEYMDMKRFPDNDNLNVVRQALQSKLTRLDPYDVVIAGDDYALTYALSEQHSLFRNIPIVFLGVNHIATALEQNDNPQVTGIVEKLFIKETIDLALSLHPNAENIFAIADGTKSMRPVTEEYFQLRRHYISKNLHLIDLGTLSWTDFFETLHSLPGNSVIVILSALLDKYSQPKSFKDSLRLIDGATDLPLYHILENGIGEGILGGKVVSHFHQGESAGQMALNVLQGYPVEEMPVLEECESKFLFDYAHLDSMGLYYNELPQNTQFINRPVSFVDEHFQLVVFVIIFIAVLLCLIIGLILNIVKRRSSEKFLLQIETAINQSPISIVITDEEANMVYVNQYLCDLTGYDKEDLLGKNPRMFSDPNYKETNYIKMWSSISQGQEWVGQFRNVKKNSEAYLERAVIQPVFNHFHQIQNYICVKEDITRLMKLTEERDAMKENLYQTQKTDSLGQLSAGIAHDFNNIVSGILMASQLLENQIPEENETGTRCCQMIQSNCDRAANLTGQLLSFSKKQKSEVKKLNLEQTIDDVIVLLSQTVKKNIVYEVENSLQEPFVYFDSNSLHSIILNLAINSAQAIEGRGEIRFFINTCQINDNYCNISPFELTSGEYISLTVQDNGCGIPHENLGNIFEQFYTTKKEGTGIGLAFVKRIIEEHNGAIEVQSLIGEGTSFTILLPALKVSEKAAVN